MAGPGRKEPGPLLLLLSREVSVWTEVLGQKGRLGDGAGRVLGRPWLWLIGVGLPAGTECGL